MELRTPNANKQTRRSPRATSGSNPESDPRGLRLPDFGGLRILVVGDVMLDRYWFGDASRLSPEAPVPVVNVMKQDTRAGGAANVAANIAALGAAVDLVGVVGNDDGGAELVALVGRMGIRPRLIATDRAPTTTKLRVIARQQQLLRVDLEQPLPESVAQDVKRAFVSAYPEADAVVFSDYGKGTLGAVRDMIDDASGGRKPLLVDPKGSDFDRYAGATVITPNKQELRDVVGPWRDESDLRARASGLRQRLGLEALLVTRSEEGMSFFAHDRVIDEPAKAREVFDVSGAGDTVISVLALMLAAGADWGAAIRVANTAAGIVVGKLGTATVSRQELLAALR